MESSSSPWRHARHKKIAPVAMVLLSGLAVDTSCTAPPHCPQWQHAQRAPSHQGHMWDCVPDRLGDPSPRGPVQS